MPREPSEEFWNAVINSGSNVIDCGFCGRTHFVDDPTSTYEEGELMELYRQNRENHDKVIFHPEESSVSWGHLDGRQAVHGCPCNQAAKYEQLFWKSRYIIRDYFTEKAEKIRKEAESESELAEAVRSAVD